jgi:hypothetical protein
VSLGQLENAKDYDQIRAAHKNKKLNNILKVLLKFPREGGGCRKN